MGPTIINDSWYRKPAGVREGISAGGVIAKLEGGKVLIALVREEDSPDYILPKGHVEPGEDLEEAARREIEEEAGLTDLLWIAELGVIERLNFAKTEWKKTFYYLFTTRQASGIPTDSTHAYQCEWFPIDKLPTIFWPDQRLLIKENQEKITELLNRQQLER